MVLATHTHTDTYTVVYRVILSLEAKGNVTSHSLYILHTGNRLLSWRRDIKCDHSRSGDPQFTHVYTTPVSLTGFSTVCMFTDD